MLTNMNHHHFLEVLVHLTEWKGVNKDLIIINRHCMILKMVAFVNSVNDPQPIINCSKLSRSKILENNIKFVLLLIKIDVAFMKLLDSFSIDPIIRLFNEERYDTENSPNLEKLYSPISIDTNLGSL